MRDKQEYKKYIESQSRAASPVTNDDLKCKDCVFRNDEFPTAYCDIFKPSTQRKPNAVLLGKNCPEYQEK